MLYLLQYYYNNQWIYFPDQILNHIPDLNYKFRVGCRISYIAE